MLVLHIDGEGIRHLGAFRQLIDGTDANNLAVQRDLDTFRQIILLTLQGVDPGAVAAQGQGAEGPDYGFAVLALNGGILFQKIACRRGLCPFPAAVLALVTGRDTEPQLVPGVHIRAGHLARQLRGAIVRIVLVRAARIPHDVAILIAAHTALEQVQLRVLAIKLHCGLVIGARDGDGHVLAHPSALVVLHEDGESIRHRGAFRQVVQGQPVAVELQCVLERLQIIIGRAVDGDRDAQRDIVAVLVQRIGIGGFAIARFLHHKLAITALGSDGPIGIRQFILGHLCCLALLAHGKMQGVAKVGIRSCDRTRGRVGPGRRVVVRIILMAGIADRHARSGITPHAGLVERLVRIADLQLGPIVGARDGDGHGLQIPGAVLVLHIDGEGIRHLGVFRQLIDVLDRNGLIIVQRDRGTFRQLHLLTLQGVDPGAVTAQGQGAEGALHGLLPRRAPGGGILFQKVAFAGGICTFPTLVAFLALVTGHSAEPQLVSGVHVMAGHGARQLLGAIVLRILRLGTRSIHDLVSGIIAAYAALEQVQL